VKKALLGVLAGLLVLAAVYAGLRLFVYDVRRFAGSHRDMWPNFGQDALVVVDRHARPERGDVVVMRRAKDGKLMLRRVVALPGDTVAFVDLRPFVDGVATSWQDGGRVYHDGKLYLVHVETLGGRSYRVLDDPLRGSGPRHAQTIDGYYVLSDRREDAEHGDSRSFGPVPAADLRGVVRWVLEPGRVPYVEAYRPNTSGAE
jgi:signal peptidase I